MITNNKKDLDEEIYKIKKLAREKGYRQTEIDDMLTRVKNNTTKGEKEDLKYGGCIEYWPKTTEAIKGVFRKYGVRIAAKPRANIFTKFRNDRDRTNEMDKSGVYEIPFKDENGQRKVYIGQTIRKIEVRKKEHIGYVAGAKNTTELSKKAYKENIEIFFSETARIAGFKTQKEGLVREAIEIRRKGKNCIANPSTYLPGIWNRFISKRKEYNRTDGDVS